MNSMDKRISKVNNEYARDNNVLKTQLNQINEEQEKEEWECNRKYNELVKEYQKQKTNQENHNFFDSVAIFVYAVPFTCTVSCFTNCDDWWSPNCDLATVWLDKWFQLHVIVPALLIVGIQFFVVIVNNGAAKRKNNKVDNSISALEHERRNELNKLQQKYNVKRQKVDDQYAENERKYSTKKQQIVAQYNQNRQKYLQQLRNSNNTVKLKKQVMVDFERIYEMIDKSVHIKEISFDFYMIVNQEDIRVSGMKGQSRLHDMGYIYQRLQMKNLENIELCEALAEVMSEEVDFIIKEHYKQAITDVKCDGTTVHIIFRIPNMNYNGLEAW